MLCHAMCYWASTHFISPASLFWAYLDWRPGSCASRQDYACRAVLADMHAVGRAW